MIKLENMYFLLQPGIPGFWKLKLKHLEFKILNKSWNFVQKSLENLKFFINFYLFSIKF